MVRLLALLDKLDLDQVRRTGERARAGLDAIAREHREILRNVRGVGVMLAFDVLRADWCEALLDRAFRRGLILLPAGARSVRFYPRYDTEAAAIDEALAILRAAIDDLSARGERPAAPVTTEAAGTGVKTRVGTLAIPIETVESVDVTPANFDACKRQILAVEQERYGLAPLQFSLDTLEATMANPRAIGVAVRDRVSGRYIAYALGSALENHDEEGVGSDPHFGENNTFYLHAAATLPAVQNAVEIENFLLESLRERAVAAGFEYLSSLIEEKLVETGPPWLRQAAILERIDNYLGSGLQFVYLHAALGGEARG
jgi:hypothetical protein